MGAMRVYGGMLAHRKIGQIDQCVFGVLVRISAPIRPGRYATFRRGRCVDIMLFFTLSPRSGPISAVRLVLRLPGRMASGDSVKSK